MATTDIGNNIINLSDLSYALAHLTSDFNNKIQDQQTYTEALMDSVRGEFVSVLHFKGGLAGASSSPGTYTYSGVTGDVYKVTTAGYINGIKVEVNDTLICTNDVERATSSNYTTVRNSWLIIQGNTDGVVIGPASATNNNIAVFDGTTGKLIKNSGYTIATSVPSGAVFTDTKVTQTATTTNATYELLFSNTANNNTLTEGARKTSTLTYNPSTKALVTGGTVNGLTFTAATTGFTIAGGTTSKTLTVSDTYTLGAACAKGVDTSIAANSTSINLPTSKAVSDFINTTLADYARLDGASFTGPVNFGDSVSADDLTAGQLMVTGNASFTNNISANTINGVEVGSSPKFTDTVYTHPTHTSYNNGLYKITINNLGHVTSATAVAKADITGLGIPAQDTTYSTATSSTLGLVKIGYTTNGKNYPVQLSNEQMYVNVPWTDTATAADNILEGSNSGTQITYAPYTSRQDKLSFDTTSINPTGTSRLNLNGYLYATKLYSGGTETKTKQTAIDKPTAETNKWVSAIGQNANGNIDVTYTELNTSGTWSGNAATATKWANAQTAYVTLGTASKTSTLQGGSSTAQTLGVDGTLGVGNGGTGKASWTQWGIVYASASDTLAQVTAGAAANNGYLLQSNGAAAPGWIEVVPVTHGGTGAKTFTSGALLIGNGTSAVGTRSITNNTANAAVVTGTSIPTMNTIYYGLAQINGASQDRGVSVYAPTAVGSNNQYLKSTGSGAPSWQSPADSSSASAISSSGTNLVTERDVYYGLPMINNSHAYTSSTTIYAPTTVGTSGQVLSSSGSGAPAWVDSSTVGSKIQIVRW